jgi:hypothetical protein
MLRVPGGNDLARTSHAERLWFIAEIRNGAIGARDFSMRIVSESFRWVSRGQIQQPHTCPALLF